ncbi:MAG: hypothetical protein ACFFD5_11075 [Candidatus Thorarchaeota archaeon]
MEKLNMNKIQNLNSLSEINVVFEDKVEKFANEVENEINNARNHLKRVEYYSDNLIIHSYKKNINLGQDVLIFESIYRKRKENQVEYSYIGNKNMYASHLLYLINKGEMILK